MKKRYLVGLALLVLLVLGLFVGGNVEMFEDGSAVIFGRGVCLVTAMGCSDWLGEEWLDSNEGDPAGYVVVGSGGKVLACYHDIGFCVRW